MLHKLIHGHAKEPDFDVYQMKEVCIKCDWKRGVK